MAALRGREQRDRLVLDVLGEFIYRVTPVRDGDPRTWSLTFINRRGEALVGMTGGRLDAESWAARIHPDDRGRVQASTTALLGSTQPATRSYRVVHAVTGATLSIEERVLPDVHADGTVVGLYVVARDATTARAAEDALRRGHEQLARAERLDAVGRLAGGLAQDFNNLLTTITGYATLVQAALPEGSPATRDAEGLIRAATRAADLTRQLQVFGGRQPTHGRPIEINAVVAGVAPMLGRLLSARIVLDTALGSAVPAVEAERGHIEQVLLHFAVNARPRTATGGRLTLSTRIADGVDAELLGDHDPAGGEGWVTLEIAGQGLAVDPSLLPAIFAPVTGGGPSKPGGRQPRLSIGSPGDDRVAVSIFFPVAATPQAGPAQDLSALPERPGGGTILVVEDDEAVRELVVDILTRDGYRTIEAGHGQAAIDELERRRQRIDLVLSDVVMPGMSGPELVRRIKRRRPDIPVLYMTGYAEPNPADAAALAAAPVLQKPFTPKALSDAVLQALAGPR
ncbi:MAG: response regulator, partial [Vicinamibacterales bacterium]